MSWKHVKIFNGNLLLRDSIIFHLMRSMGYFLFLYRGIYPDFLSSTAANVLLFLAFYLDAQMLLRETKLDTPSLRKYGLGNFVVVSVLYILQDVFLNNANLRVAIASMAVMLTFAPAVLKCMFGKQSTALNRSFLWPYLMLVVLAIPRAVRGVANAEYTLFQGDILQSVFFVTLLLKAFFGTLFLFVTLLSDSSNEIVRMAHDPLTGLYNRRAFLGKCEKLFNKRKQDKGCFGVFFLDIDFFKRINDTWGHDMGDEMIIRVGKAVQCSIDVKDICCRHGGDEFLVAIALDDLKLAKMIAARIQERLRKIDLIPEQTITSSMGFAYGVPLEHECIDDYIKKADQAMYLSKQNGRDRLTILEIR